MAFLSWIFLTLATGVAMLVGRWLTLTPGKKMYFDGAVWAGVIAGSVFAVVGGLLSATAQLGFMYGAVGLAFLAILFSIIGFVITVVMAWAVFQAWSNTLRDRLNHQFPRGGGPGNQPMPPYPHGGQYPPRPQGPPSNPTNWPGQGPNQ